MLKVTESDCGLKFVCKSYLGKTSMLYKRWDGATHITYILFYCLGKTVAQFELESWGAFHSTKNPG